MKLRLFALLIAFIPFAAYTAIVIMDHGYTGSGVRRDLTFHVADGFEVSCDVFVELDRVG